MLYILKGKEVYVCFLKKKICSITNDLVAIPLKRQDIRNRKNGSGTQRV